MKQHIADITIIWPDDRWEQEVEQSYLLNALRGVVEHFEQVPIVNREHTRELFNPLGRKYANIVISPIVASQA